MSAPVICSGCEQHREPAGWLGAGGRLGPVCEGCATRCEDSIVWARVLGRAVAVGRTVPEMERAFASRGLTLPTNPQGVRRVAAELARRFEADTGLQAPSVDEVFEALTGSRP